MLTWHRWCGCSPRQRNGVILELEAWGSCEGPSSSSPYLGVGTDIGCTWPGNWTFALLIITLAFAFGKASVESTEICLCFLCTLIGSAVGSGPGEGSSSWPGSSISSLGTSGLENGFDGELGSCGSPKSWIPEVCNEWAQTWWQNLPLWICPEFPFCTKGTLWLHQFKIIFTAVVNTPCEGSHRQWLVMSMKRQPRCILILLFWCFLKAKNWADSESGGVITRKHVPRSSCHFITSRQNL